MTIPSGSRSMMARRLGAWLVFGSISAIIANQTHPWSGEPVIVQLGAKALVRDTTELLQPPGPAQYRLSALRLLPLTSSAQEGGTTVQIRPDALRHWQQPAHQGRHRKPESH